MVTEVGRDWQPGSAFSRPSYPVQDLLKTPASIVRAALDRLVSGLRGRRTGLKAARV
ncbi:MAG: hypothetical protein V3U28_06750 [Candidatus Acidoferrales bacterium]